MKGQWKLAVYSKSGERGFVYGWNNCIKDNLIICIL